VGNNDYLTGESAMAEKESRQFNKRNSVIVFGIILIFALGYKFGIPAYTVYSAKRDLEKIGIPFSEQKFVESACNGDVGTVQLFIQAGMNINVLASPGKNDATPRSALHCAASKGQVAMAKSLLEQGANVNLQDEEGNTPLWYVARAGSMARDGVIHSTEMAQLLIGHKADVNLQGVKGSPFLAAIASRQLELVDYLMENGADVKARNEQGSTALMEIIQRYYGSSRNEVVARAKALVQAGVDVNVQNNSGNTALMMACMSRQYPLIEALLAMGADPNLSNNNGQTAIVSSLYDPDAFKLLVRHGANLNVKINGSTLLHQAVMNRNPAVLSLLLASEKLDVNAKNDRGETALFLTTSRGNSMLMQQLLMAGAKPDVMNNQLQTPLIRAVYNNALDTARVLIEWHADVNARDGNGHTALFYAKQRAENMIHYQADGNSVAAAERVYANRPFMVDGRLITPEGAPAPSPVMPAPSAYDPPVVWRKTQTSSSSFNRGSSSPSALKSKITISDPMVDLLVKAGGQV
jgi:ankyrin repeat protein